MSGKSPARAVAKKRAQPETFRGRALTASLTVKDIQKSLAWYTAVLGFTAGEKYERDGKLMYVSLKAGSVELGLSQDDGAKGMDRIKGEGFSLQITTAQDVDAIAKRIKAAGAVLTSEPADAWGARVFRLTDPDGFKFVISSER